MTRPSLSRPTAQTGAASSTLACDACSCEVCFACLFVTLLDSCPQEVFSKKLIHKDFYNTFDDDCDPDVDQ